MATADAIGLDVIRLARSKAIRRRRRARSRSEGRDAVRRYKRYRHDPVGFAHHELGITAWSSQAELLDAASDHDRVLCRSGHKCGKSLACVVLALWWVCTRARGRVILTAPTFHQVKDILWRELALWYPKVKVALGNIDLPKDPSTGLELAGGRQIMGISTAKPENLAGISGSELLFIVDEASGYPDELYDVIKGNAAGGAKIVAISNPTRNVGWFFSGFRASRGTYDLRAANDNGIPRHRWRLLHISSEDAAAYNAANDNAIPGLATSEWIAEMQEEHGPDYEESAIYLVRVRGDFPEQDTDSVIGYRWLRLARGRWHPEMEAYGELSIGVDVARFGNDETVLQPVRGAFAWPCEAMSGADGPAVAEAVVRQALALRRPGERVRVTVDGIGVGASVVDALRHHEDVRAGRIYVVDVNVGSESDDGDHLNLRSQLWFGVQDWLRSGGALPPDEDLEGELLAPTYTFDARGRKQVASKKEIRKVIKRSPDRADALCLALYRKAVQYDYESASTRTHDRVADPLWSDNDDDGFGGRTGAL